MEEERGNWVIRQEKKVLKKCDSPIPRRPSGSFARTETGETAPHLTNK